MSRLQQYLIMESTESGRTKTLTKEEFIDLARKNCRVAVRNYLNDRCTIKRGTFNSQVYMYGDASKAHVPRKSKNSTNHYTLWMDNHQLWKDYPKRSMSFICSSGQYSTHFGRYTHVILPYDGVKIGVSGGGGEDIWDTNMTESVNSDLQALFEAVFQVQEDADAAFGYSDRNWNMFSWCIQAFDKLKVGDMSMRDYLREENILEYNTFTGKRWKGTLEKTLQHMWDPDTNDVWLGDASDEINNNHECWMEGPVLMLINDKDTIKILREI